MNIVFFRRFLTVLSFLLLFFSVSGLHAETFLFGGAELARIVDLAMEHNPDVSAARSGVDQYSAIHRSEQGFFDPHLAASAGYGRHARSVPWSSLSSGLIDDNAFSGSAGVEFPLLPGAYFSAGLAEHYLLEPGGEFDSLYQTLAGGQLWVPLLRDRGLAQWRARERAAFSRRNSSEFELLDVMQSVRFAVELAYIDLLRFAAGIEEAEMSASRVEKLLEEAESLVELKVVPSYQLHSAKMEVAFHEDELVAAKDVFSAGLIRISALVGIDVAEMIEIDDDSILKWAVKCSDPIFPALDDALRARGSYLAIESLMRAVESDIKLSAEKAKSDLGVSLKATWQGEHQNNFVGTDLLITERHVGAEAALVWRRPLGFRSERAEVAANKAVLRGVADKMRSVSLNINADISVASNAFQAASLRLDSAFRAVGEAEKALAAEDERFRMGEGRSRNVLDAQKDLTNVVRRRNNAAAELLKAFVRIQHSAGYVQ